MRATQKIACEFCGERICEIFKHVDASQVIATAVASHVGYCPSRPAHLRGDMLLAYADDLVNSLKRRRAIRRQMANQRR